MEKRNLSYLVFILLCKRERRQQILCRWHTKQPLDGSDAVDIIVKFINIILHEPIRFQMTQTDISLWRGKLSIPHTWMTTDEKNMVSNLYKKHKTLFKQREKYEANCFKFSRCTIQNKLYSIYSLQHRRELIRDFAAICLTIRKKQTHHFRWLLIQVCQQIMISRSKPDRFIFELHNQLQLDGNVREIPVI